MRYAFLIFSLFVAALAPLSARAQMEVFQSTPPTMSQETSAGMFQDMASAEPLVKIRILPERALVKGGQEIWIGIEQSIAEHWHTYWLNPGDSGTPPSVEWVMPEGFLMSRIYWPTPKKLPYGPLLNYGYENQVMLLQKLTLPEELPEGEITLTADVELLVCKEECIPEYGTYTLTLNGRNAADEDNTAYFSAAEQNLPQQTNWSAFFSEDTSQANPAHFVFKIEATPETLEGINLNTVALFPKEWGMINNAAPLQAVIQDGVLVIKQPRGEKAIDSFQTLGAVVSFETADGLSHSYAVNANREGTFMPKIFESSQTRDGVKTAFSPLLFIQAFIFALLGGLILNLMPCVFPILSIKALSLVKTAEKHPREACLHGISYTAGVMLSFLAIAGILIALQAGGAQIGWGFQLQNPLVVGLLGYLLFIIGLNLIGFFEFSNPFGNLGGGLTRLEGPSGSFFTGVLATLVATPCTAPFMAGAIGFALVQPAAVSLLIFSALGFGLALPYLILSIMPAAQKAMPKPGPWMETFKQFLSFPMFGAALWLFWVLSQQTGNMGAAAVLLGAILITFALWVLKHKPAHKILRLIAIGIALFSFVLAVALIPAWSKNQTAIEGKGLEFGKLYTPAALQEALSGPNPVLTEMTAAWCITCKVNNAVAINIPSTKKLFADENVEYLIGDWTNQDPEITKYLKSYGRNGVPLYVFYGRPDPVTNLRPEPKLLPQVLTPSIVEDFVKQKS